MFVVFLVLFAARPSNAVFIEAVTVLELTGVLARPSRPAHNRTRDLLVTVKGQTADMAALSVRADGRRLFRRLSCSVMTASSCWLWSSAPF